MPFFSIILTFFVCVIIWGIFDGNMTMQDNPDWKKSDPSKLDWLQIATLLKGKWTEKFITL